MILRMTLIAMLRNSSDLLGRLRFADGTTAPGGGHIVIRYRQARSRASHSPSFKPQDIEGL